MGLSELIRMDHIKRNAVIYVRQSSVNQIISNQESLKLQYGLKLKALDLGWSECSIEIIDCDLGLSGASIENRNGFKDLVTKVIMGEVGIILSYDVTRLSRNCSDWYKLLDVCGIRDCLIADRDGVYDPSSANGRLLLGLKGQISEMELHTLKGRLRAGLLNKAKRGELALRLPIGLVRDKSGIVSKSPNIEIQCRIDMIFETFLKLKSAGKTLRYLNEQSILIPCLDNFHEVSWKRPTVNAIVRILKNPAYAGIFVYGRTRQKKSDLMLKNRARSMVPVEDWQIKADNKYPHYITQETYYKIISMLKDNYSEYNRNKTRGIPRAGSALLHGIVYCGECGHKMVMQYKPEPRYQCGQLRHLYGTKICQNIRAFPVDPFVIHAFFVAVSPIEIDIYEKAIKSAMADEDRISEAKLHQLERTRYQARLAEKQFNQADPDNRLVTAELERRWEVALRELKAAEDDFRFRTNSSLSAREIPEDLRQEFENIGINLPMVWAKNILSQQQKKALLRSLIDKVVIHRKNRDTIHIRIVWKGGDYSEDDIKVTVGSLSELSEINKMEDIVVDMVKSGKKDSEIATKLSEDGYRSPLRSWVLPSTVRAIRLRKGLSRNSTYQRPHAVDGYLTVSQVANHIGVKSSWIYDRINNGKIVLEKTKVQKRYLFPDQPSTLKNFQDFKLGRLKILIY